MLFAHTNASEENVEYLTHFQTKLMTEIQDRSDPTNCRYYEGTTPSDSEADSKLVKVVAVKKQKFKFEKTVDKKRNLKKRTAYEAFGQDS